MRFDDRQITEFKDFLSEESKKESSPFDRMRKCNSETDLGPRTFTKEMVRGLRTNKSNSGSISDGGDRRGTDYFLDFPPLKKVSSSSDIEGMQISAADQGGENALNKEESRNQNMYLSNRELKVANEAIDSGKPLPQRMRKAKNPARNVGLSISPPNYQSIPFRGNVVNGVYIPGRTTPTVADSDQVSSIDNGGRVQVGSYSGDSSDVDVHFEVEVSDEEGKKIEEAMGKMVWVRRPYDMPINSLYAAFAEKIGGCNIIAVNPCSDDRLEVMVSTLEFAEYLLNQGITVDHMWIQVYRIEERPIRVVMKNVPPFIPNSLLCKVINKYGVCKEKEFLTERIGTFNQEFKHILSSRRVTWIRVSDEPPLPETLAIKFGTRVFNIQIQSGHMACAFCGKTGHAHAFCTQWKDDVKKLKKDRRKKKEEDRSIPVVGSGGNNLSSQAGNEGWKIKDDGLKKINEEWQLVKKKNKQINKVVSGALEPESLAVVSDYNSIDNNLRTVNKYQLLTDEVLANESGVNCDCVEVTNVIGDSGSDIGLGSGPIKLNRQGGKKVYTRSYPVTCNAVEDGVRLYIAMQEASNGCDKNSVNPKGSDKRKDRSSWISKLYFRVINSGMDPEEDAKKLTSDCFRRVMMEMSDEVLIEMDSMPRESLEILLANLDKFKLTRVKMDVGKLDDVSKMEFETSKNIRKRVRVSEADGSATEEEEKEIGSVKVKGGERGAVRKKKKNLIPPEVESKEVQSGDEDFYSSDETSSQEIIEIGSLDNQSLRETECKNSLEQQTVISNPVEGLSTHEIESILLECELPLSPVTNSDIYLWETNF